MRSEGLLHNPRRWWSFALALLLLGAGWTWASRVPTATANAGLPPSPREGLPAPDLTLAIADGGSATLSRERGKVVVINFWASWCGPCGLEMPVIQKVYAGDRDRGLVVLAVNTAYQDGEPAAQRFAHGLGLTFPILLDRDGKVSRLYLLHALPSTYIVDRRGIVRAVIIGGPMTEALLRSKVEPLLQEAP